jgi:hypothetical protein
MASAVMEVTRKSNAKRYLLILALVILAVIVGWFLGGGNKAKEGVAYVVALEEYVYGYPLVMMDVTRELLTATPTTGQYAAPINQFGRIRTYVNPDFKNVVRISVNSLWSHGFLDLDQEPMIVSIPDMDGRYIVVQGLNMWTDDFMSAGTRTNGGKAANYMVAGPKWNGTAPQGVDQVFKCATRYAWVLVQMSAASPADFPAIHTKQDQLKITPLSAWGKPYSPPATVPVNPNADVTATPFDQVRLMSGEMFFNRLAKALADNPPYPADSVKIDLLKKLGVEVGKPFDAAKLNPDVLQGINAVPYEVNKLFEAGPFTMKTVNGWINMLDIGAYGTDYQTRAYVAYMGLGALAKEDAVYPTAFVDSKNTALDGSRKYVMHFEKGGLPPSKPGVWSISPYRGNFYVPNSLNRYGILSSMPLKYNGDGSLDIYMQKDSPGADKESNWLPIPPSGMFNLTVRSYQPGEGLLDGSYKLPPVVEVQ